MMKYKAFLLLMVCMCVPSLVQAETVLRTGENVSVDADQIVDGDYYVSAGPFSGTTMSGVVKGDMYAFGGAVTVNGTIAQDLTVVGGMTHMHASVTDDVRIVGGEVTIGEHIGGDLFVLGGVLTVLSTANIDGDIIFFGGEAEINGTVGGSIMGTSESMRIDAKVQGDVDVTTTSHLTLGEKANIAGYVHYTSADSLIRAQNATVGGEVAQTKYSGKILSAEMKARDVLIPIFITLFATLSLYLLFGKELQKLVIHAQSSIIKSTLLGLGVIVLGPVVAAILIATMLGIMVGIIVGLLVFLAYVVGFALSGVIVGAYVSLWFTKKTHVTLPWILMGTLVLHILLFVPIVGPVAVLFVYALTVGGLTIGTYKLLS